MRPGVSACAAAPLTSVTNSSPAVLWFASTAHVAYAALFRRPMWPPKEYKFCWALIVSRELQTMATSRDYFPFSLLTHVFFTYVPMFDSMHEEGNLKPRQPTVSTLPFTSQGWWGAAGTARAEGLKTEHSALATQLETCAVHRRRLHADFSCRTLI